MHSTRTHRSPHPASNIAARIKKNSLFILHKVSLFKYTHLFANGNGLHYLCIINQHNMVRHIILWQLKDELTDMEKQQVKVQIKEGLEALKDKVPGIIDIKVHIQGLETSNADLMLESSFVSQEALNGYSIHPEHVKVAGGVVRPNTKSRTCLDFEA